MQNANNPWFGIPAEISSQFTSVEEAIQWWKDQEPPKLVNENGEEITFIAATQLATENLSKATEEAKRLLLGNADIFAVAKLAKNDFKIKISIE